MVRVNQVVSKHSKCRIASAKDGKTSLQTAQKQGYDASGEQRNCGPTTCVNDFGLSMVVWKRHGLALGRGAGSD